MQHERDMKPTKKLTRQRPTAVKLRSWRASLIRKRAQYLGAVDAPNEKAAEAVAVAEFNLSDEQRRRLVVQERNQTRIGASRTNPSLAPQ